MSQIGGMQARSRVIAPKWRYAHRDHVEFFASRLLAHCAKMALRRAIADISAKYRG